MREKCEACMASKEYQKAKRKLTIAERDIRVFGLDPSVKWRPKHRIITPMERDALDKYDQAQETLNAIHNSNPSVEPLLSVNPLLTKREQEVFNLFSDGYSNRQTSEILGISARA